MKKIIDTVLIWCAANWDKVLHCVINYAMVITLCRVTDMPTVIILTAAVDILKEVYDQTCGGGWDINDIYADTVGIVLAVLAISVTT